MKSTNCFCLTLLYDSECVTIIKLIILDRISLIRTFHFSLFTFHFQVELAKLVSCYSIFITPSSLFSKMRYNDCKITTYFSFYRLLFVKNAYKSRILPSIMLIIAEKWLLLCSQMRIYAMARIMITEFQKFTIDDGNIVWGEDWDLVFPVEQLYAGAIA